MARRSTLEAFATTCTHNKESSKKAFASTSCGKSHNFEFRDIPRPEPTSGQLLVEVHAAGLNPLDLMIAEGEFKQVLPYSLP